MSVCTKILIEPAHGCRVEFPYRHEPESEGEEWIATES